jgi:hypothetical protein
MRFLSIAAPLLALAPTLALAAPSGGAYVDLGWSKASKCRDDWPYNKDDGNVDHNYKPYNHEKHYVKVSKSRYCNKNEECSGRFSTCWQHKCVDFVDANDCKPDHDKHDKHDDDKDHDKHDKHDDDKHDKRDKDHDKHDKHDKPDHDKHDHNKHDHDKPDCKDKDGKDKDCKDKGCRGNDCY